MSKKAWAVLITTFVGVGIVIYFSAVVYKGEQWGALGVAIAMAIELGIMLFTGLILLGNQKTKPIGQGVLLGSLLTLVIGFAVCSTVG